MVIKKAVLRNFNVNSYLATIEIAGSSKAYLENITVAKNLVSSEMVNGRKLVVVFFDEHNAKEAVVVAVYS